MCRERLKAESKGERRKNESKNAIQGPKKDLNKKKLAMYWGSDKKADFRI